MTRWCGRSKALESYLDGAAGEVSFQAQLPSSGSRVHLLFFAVLEFAGDPVGCVYEQNCWIELASLPTLDFLEGDLDFIRRLSRGDFAEHLT